MPFAFALADPATNGLPAAFLIFSFVGTGSFIPRLRHHGRQTRPRDRAARQKSLYYLGGLTEGTETIAVFVLACLLPGWFPMIAWVFGGLCWLTTATRITVAWQTLR